MIATAANVRFLTAGNEPMSRRPCLPYAACLIGAWALALLTPGLAYPASAQTLPHSSRLVRIMIGGGAGGSLDVETRIIAQALGDFLHQDVVIENRPGGGGIIAGEAVANTPPDGNTLFSCAGDLFTVASLMRRATFDPNKRLVPIAQMSATPLAVVTGGRAPFNDVKGMIAAAAASPQGFTYATYAVASVNNVVGQWIAKQANIKLLNITYRTGPEAALATAAGDVTLAITSPVSVYPSLTNAGTVKVIGITSAEHPSYLPMSWQTLAENGMPIDVAVYIGLFAPAGTPSPIVARLDHALSAVLKDVMVRRRLLRVGIYPKYLGPADFLARVQTDKIHYERIIAEMHMMDAQR